MKIVVNGQEIAEEAFKAELQQAQAQMQGATQAQRREEAVRRIVERTLLRQEANRCISDVSSKDVQEELDRLMARHGGREQFFRRYNMSAGNEPDLRSDIRQNIKIDRLLDRLGSDAPQPSDGQIREYFDRNSDDYVTPEEVHAFHIVKQVTPPTAASVHHELTAIRERLLNGEEFAAVADQSSSCNDPGGDLGFVSRGKMVEEFEIVAFSLREGEISPVFKTPFGYHLATITERRESRPMTFEEAEGEVREMLHAQVRRTRVERWLEEARAKASVQVEETHEEAEG